jgi:multiple sugar transport system substrate-binding protein/sn-glycerol 3-phosphate transport system substrate-binding protein
MSKKSLIWIVLAIFVLSTVLGACTPAETPVEEPVVEEPAAEEPAEEVVAEEPAAEEEVVEEAPAFAGTTVTFWHVYGEGLPNEAMVALVDEFNKTNEWGITVEALDQGQYRDIEDKMNAAIQSGDLPDIVMAYTNALADWYSVDAIVDLNPMIGDAEYGLTAEEIAAIYPSAFDAGLMPDGARIAFPQTQSANVMVYNNTWAQELGFDAQPTTAAEFKEQICAAAAANAELGGDFAGTGGLVYYPSSTNWLHFLFAFGGSPLNEAGDAYDFSSEAAVAASLYLNDLRDSGCTFQTESYPNPEQAQRKALVTMSSTAGLPYYEAAFADAENDDDWGFMAGFGPEGQMAVDAFQQMFGVVNTTPEKAMASWLFISWLTNAENQATWIESSGYLPTQSTSLELLADYAAENPVWATGAEIAAYGPAEPQTFPAWSSVRRAIGDAAAQLFQAETEEDVVQILADLTTTANDLVAELE